MDDSQGAEDVALETPPANIFIPPSIDRAALLSGASYNYFSPVPPSLLPPPPSDATPLDPTTTPPAGPPCVLGVDEAGRGPVLGPMVYGIFYLPLPLSDPLLRSEHHFDDSKALTPAVRSALMAALCRRGSSLHAQCGWATSSLSARDIGAGMMSRAAYNLNAQAFDATVALIRGAMERGVNVAEIYVDTVGPPAAYQKRLERLFPTARITVAKKADSLYPCVSAASVCAKVTRDAALEVLYEGLQAREGGGQGVDGGEEEQAMAWGSGYPSDARCVNWMKANMHPVFGWGPECRFSWGTAKDMLEAGSNPVKVEWPVEDDGENARVTDYFNAGLAGKDSDELGSWFGTPVGLEAF